jgi:hypothetical protein
MTWLGRIGGIGMVILLEYMFGFFGFQPKALMLILIVLGLFWILRAFTASRGKQIEEFGRMTNEL